MELHSRIPAGDAGDAGDSGATATLRVTLYSVRGGEADRTLRRPERVGLGCACRRCLSGLEYSCCMVMQWAPKEFKVTLHQG